MTLSSGARLGSYVILAPLGAGGMGEVYRALDSKLQREVAIKVLPAEWAGDANRVARFRREALALASLNHPNVAAIYGLEEADGVVALALELVEGEDLLQRLRRGPIPMDEWIGIARQIAEGLEAAHEKGITHRDLKPANVKIREDGSVKILDFGLAKVFESGVEEGSGDLSDSPTVSRQTEMGVILGTAAYMSPEQARGKLVDKRSDIWSFGVVLFEMLTGKRLFQGETVSDMLAAVLRQEVKFEDLPEDTPEGVLRLLKRCLERDPRNRLRDIGEARVALGDPSILHAPAAPLPARKRMHPGALLGLAAALVLLAGVIFLKQTPAPAWPSFQRVTFRRGTVTAARFLSDAGSIAYSAQWEGKPSEVFTVRTPGNESSSTGVTDAMLLALSPTDEMLVKLHPRLWTSLFHGTLARVPLNGGTPRELLENVQDADWAPDGSSFATLSLETGVRWFIEFPERKRLREEHVAVRAFRMSPDGTRIAILQGGYFARLASVAVIDLKGDKKVLASDPATGLAWNNAGTEVWFTSVAPGGATDLFAVDLDGKKRLLFRSAGSLVLQDISRNGDLLVNIQREQASVMCRTSGQALETDLAWLGETRASAISSDGRMLLLNQAEWIKRSASVFYLRAIDGSPAIRLGEGAANSISRDGKWVLARSNESQKQLLIVPTGAGQSKQISVPMNAGQWWFFPDGRRILVSGILPDGHARLFSIDLDGNAYKDVAPEGVDTFIGEDPISPDGKFVAASGGRGSLTGLQLFPTDGGAPQEVPGVEEDDVVIRWAEDGKSLFVFKRDQLPTPVFRLDVQTGRRTPWLELMPADPAGVIRIPTIVLTPDGRSYAYNITRRLSELYIIRGIQGGK